MKTFLIRILIGVVGILIGLIKKLETNNPPQGEWWFQAEASKWVVDCFGQKLMMDPVERRRRFLEEALELAQALGCKNLEALDLVAYVYNRKIGDVPQEIGGVMVTLAALTHSQGYCMSKLGDIELKRCLKNSDKIRAKQAAKPKNIAS